jgi:RNA polymerase sigma-70 factor, ECF subfamily
VKQSDELKHVAVGANGAARSDCPTATNPSSGAGGEPERANSLDGLRALLESHQDGICRFVAARLDNETEAQDIVQQTFLQALRNLDAFNGTDLRPWLLSIARRQIIDRHREHGRVEFVPIDDEQNQGTVAPLRSQADGVQGLCDARARVQCCLDCITTLLPPEEQVAVLMTDVHGFTGRESAQRLGMSLPNVKYVLRTARRKLHQAALCEVDTECALVSKTGVEHACPGCAHGGEPPKSRRRGGPDAATLTALRRELVEALSLDGVRGTGEGV